MILDTVTQPPDHAYQALEAPAAFTLVDVPYAVRWRHLIQGEPPPPLADELITETLRCVLTGDALPEHEQS